MRDDGLIRAVGVRGLTAGMINYTIGAGIFALPAVVAAAVGAAAPVIYLICAAAMLLIVACFAEAGSRVSLSGGTYGYAEKAFGPYAGFIVATSLWFGANVLASAAVANIFVDTLAAIHAPLGDRSFRAVILVVMFALFAAINIRGVKTGSRTVQTVTVAKLTPLLILVAFGLFAMNGSNLAWPGMPPADDVARTSVTLLFAFLGIESALTPSGEVRDPVRTVPRAILATIAIVTTLYILLQMVAQGVLGPDLATSTQAPLAETAKRVLGSGGQMLVLIGAAISTFGYVAGDILASPRGIFALARDGMFPSIVGRIHERYRTPHVAILVHAALAAAFAVTGSFAGLVVFATLATLIVYLICCAATIQLRRKDIRTEGAIPFRVPGGPVVPVLALGVVVWLMSASTQKEFIGLAVMLAIETVLYFVMRRIRKA